MFKFLVLFFILHGHSSDAAKILVVAPMFGKSHSMFIHPICLELVNRGHEVSLITSNLIQNAPGNLTQIRVDQKTRSEIETTFDPNKIKLDEQMPFLIRFLMYVPMFTSLTARYMESPPIKKFVEEDKTKFDLVIAEMMFQETVYMFAHKYKTPLILLGSSTYFSSISSFMGDPETISYINHEFFDEDYDDSLVMRMKNHFLYIFIKIVDFVYTMPTHNGFARKYFKNYEPVPSLQEIQKDISLVLLNTHFSIDNVRPTVPGIVEVGGLHIKPPQKLPEDIQEFLDGAEHGAILFSLGTVVISSKLGEGYIETILSVFERLKQRILWKWESDDPPPRMLENVLTRKWLPQSDILAHPNLKLFITHCGMLSLQEIIHRGVPIVGLPFHGDQPSNMLKLVKRGFGIGMSFHAMTEEKLLGAIKEVLGNPKYARTAKAVSLRFKDRQNPPMETAMYWIEYVIRHKGAHFMKSLAVNQAWWKYYSVDAILVFSIFAAVYTAVSVKFVVFLYRKCIKKKTVNVSKKNE